MIIHSELIGCIADKLVSQRYMEEENGTSKLVSSKLFFSSRDMTTCFQLNIHTPQDRLAELRRSVVVNLSKEKTQPHIHSSTRNESQLSVLVMMSVLVYQLLIFV